MSVLDAYKIKCENCNKAKLVCAKHFYIYCADSKLEEYYIRDMKINKFFTKNQENIDFSVISSTSSTPTIITTFSNEEISPEINS